jgi:hypothetical protein
MARSAATTVDEYISELPVDRQVVLSAVRRTILEHLPVGYRESMNWGMISYEVPLDRYPHTPNGQPLMYAALAARKGGYSLHLMSIYAEGEDGLRRDFEKAGKRLDMGKACVRFRQLEDLPLGVIGEVLRRTSVDDFIALFEAGRKRKD